jgi:hypothetical protein
MPGGDPARLETLTRDYDVYCAVSAPAGEGSGADNSSPPAEQPVDAEDATADPALGPSAAAAAAVLRCIPLRRLLVCSDSPWHTPQNHPDSHVRTQRNEPSNTPFVVQAVLAARNDGLPESALRQTLKNNALRAFGLEAGGESGTRLPHADPSAETAAAAAAAESGDGAVEGGTALPALDGSSSTATAQRQSAAAAADSGKSLGDGTPLPAATSPATAAAEFHCLKCRALLFTLGQVAAHEIAVPFSLAGDHGVAVAGAGLCSAHVFVAHALDCVALRVRGGNIECVECNQKLGRYSEGTVGVFCLFLSIFCLF